MENNSLSDSGKMLIVCGVCNHGTYKTRESLICDTKSKFKTLGFTDSDELIKTVVEQLIIRNISAEGKRIQREQVM